MIAIIFLRLPYNSIFKILSCNLIFKWKFSSNHFISFQTFLSAIHKSAHIFFHSTSSLAIIHHDKIA